MPPPPLRELWRRGQEGWPRRYVLVQLPNAPLLVALAVWALQELVQGVNGFRRALGLVVLVLLAVRLVS